MKKFKHHLSSIIIGFLVTLLMAALSTLPGTNTAHHEIENRLFDLRMKWRKKVPQSKFITHIDVDDLSINSLGRWPWKRSVHGGLVETIAYLGGKYSVFDIEFYRESQATFNLEGFQRTYSDFEEKLKRIIPEEELRKIFLDAFFSTLQQYEKKAIDEGTFKKGVETLINNTLGSCKDHSQKTAREIAEPLWKLIDDEDAKFAESIKVAGNVILPFHFNPIEDFDHNVFTPEILQKYHDVIISKTYKELLTKDRSGESSTGIEASRYLSRQTGIPLETLSGYSDLVNKSIFLEKQENRKILRQILDSHPERLNIDEEVWANLANLQIPAPEWKLDYNLLKTPLRKLKEELIREIVSEILDKEPDRSLSNPKDVEEVWAPLYPFPDGADRTQTGLAEKHVKLYIDRHKAEKELRTRFQANVQGVNESTSCIGGALLEPAMYPMIHNTYSCGFVSIQSDSDGILRHIPMIGIHEGTGQYYVQMAAQSIMNFMQIKTIEVSPEGNRIALKSAIFPDGSRKDIVIPVNKDGQTRINWAGDTDVDAWKDTFNHVPFQNIYSLYEMRSKFQDSIFSCFLNLNVACNGKAEEFGGELAEHFKGVVDASELKAKYPNFYDYIVMKTEDAKQKQGELLANVKALSIQDSMTIVELFPKAIDGYFENLKKRPTKKAELLAGLKEAAKTPFLEAVEVIHQKIRRSEEWAKALRPFIDGKICIVGSAHTGSTDFKATPLSPKVPGVMAHSNLMNMMLNPEIFIFEAPRWKNLLYAVLSGLAITLLATFTGPIRAVTITFLSFVGYFLLSLWLLSHKAYLIEATTPMSCILFSFVGVTLFRQMTEGREKRMIKETFGRFLSPEYINELMEDPDKLKLGGEQREITAHFSDLAKFSTISEKLGDSQKLVALLNKYLTPMTDIIQQHKGTLDKYEGDAIIAFYGAPGHVPNHAELSVVAALKEQERLTTLEDELRPLGLVPEGIGLKARIGLNSGMATVGLMGSEKAHNYTMMGDTVNLASRLEGANKFFGTRIMIGENTHDALNDKFFCRRLGKLVVVGRKSAVRIYEPYGYINDVSEENKKMVELFHEALDHFYAKNWHAAEAGFKKVGEHYPKEPAHKYYLDYVEDYRNRELPDDWNGEITLTEKG